jgi:hypothetical protein
MHSKRVFILAGRPLFAQGVESLLSSRSGIEVVGVACGGPDAFPDMCAAEPDVVIVAAKAEQQSRLIAEVLDAIPGARVVGLTPEGNLIHTYFQQMRQGQRVEDLLEAIGEPLDWRVRGPGTLQLFVLFQGRYGQRILDHIRRFAPKEWTIDAWRAPLALPQVVDDPPEHLPMHLPPADLVLSLGESVAVAQLLPCIAERTGARAVVGPVDNVAWLPSGLVQQLRTWLAEMGVVAVFPKPFCSLTERSYNGRKQEIEFVSPAISEFAHHFGRPVFRVACAAVDRDDRMQIVEVEVQRDAPCGCARAVARQLVGTDVQDAIVQTGLFQHHYPCLATMRVDTDLGEPLIQVSGGFMRQAVKVEIAPFLASRDAAARGAGP